MTRNQTALLESIREALPTMLAGENEPSCRVWSKRGTIQDHWDRPPMVELVLPHCDDVLDVVAELADVRRAEIRGIRRNSKVARARQMVCYLIRELRPGLSLPRIAKFMRRDHTTVLHSTKVIDARLLAKDEETVQLYITAKHRLMAR